MAEGTVQLPADGSGKILRTITNAGVASGAHQEVVTVADADGNLFDFDGLLAAVDGLEGSLTSILGAVDGLETNTTGLATQTTAAALLAAVDGLEGSLTSILASLGDNTLTGRMFAKRPTTGYRLWFETTLTTFIYIAEATSATTDLTSFAWRGIRIPLVTGAPSGEVEESLGFRWDTKAANGPTPWS